MTITNSPPTTKLRAVPKSAAATSTNLHLSPSDCRKLDDMIARLAGLVGLKVSRPVALRAGINALAGFANTVEAEQRKPSGRSTGAQRPGYREMALRLWIASAG